MSKDLTQAPQPSLMGSEPVGYVTKLELETLRRGASCVDLFGEVAPKGLEMVPLYEHPPQRHVTMLLQAKADTIRKEYQLAYSRPCDCSTPDGALHYGRAQGLEIASDIIAAEAAEEIDRLNATIHSLMAKLADLLDEDKFADCEDIVRRASISPPPQTNVIAPADFEQKLSDFLEALDEWGCDDNIERAQQILEFQRTGYDLDAYLVEHPDREKSELN